MITPNDDDNTGPNNAVIHVIWAPGYHFLTIRQQSMLATDNNNHKSQTMPSFASLGLSHPICLLALSWSLDQPCIIIYRIRGNCVQERHGLHADPSVVGALATDDDRHNDKLRWTNYDGRINAHFHDENLSTPLTKFLIMYNPDAPALNANETLKDASEIEFCHSPSTQEQPLLPDTSKKCKRTEELDQESDSNDTLPSVIGKPLPGLKGKEPA
ncbi:hypothetical protein BYT27DRAFT_7261564 [Phlegmacium glaucopus]|nr:hypothetical protein BYT27DRAFT_7261564 [Phlegmacium glaucopus]